MRRNARIIQISGFKGIVMAIFMVTCLVAGFVAFPGFVLMHIWNFFAGESFTNLGLWQGILLWAIIALTCFICSKQSFSVSFGIPKELNEDEMHELMERIRMQSQAKFIDQMIMKSINEIKKEENENCKEEEIHK